MVRAVLRKFLLQADISLLAGNLHQSRVALDEATKLNRKLPQGHYERDYWGRIATGHLGLGELGRSAMALNDADPARRNAMSIWIAVFSQDRKRLASLAAESEQFPSEPGSLIGLLRGGEIRTAANHLARKRWAVGVTPDFVHAAEGELAFRQGHPQEAIGLLNTALRSLPESTCVWVLASQTLAQAHVSLGNVDEATRILEKATGGIRGCNSLRQVCWLHARYDLMELYRRQNRVQEAEAIRQELKTLLALADENFVLRAKVSGNLSAAR